MGTAMSIKHVLVYVGIFAAGAGLGYWYCNSRSS